MHNDEYSILKNAPEHEIQADEAWNEMLKLLDEQMPVSKPGKRTGSSFSAFVVALAVAAAGLTISALLVLQPFNHPKPSKDSKPSSDSLPVKALAARCAEEDVEPRRADTDGRTADPLMAVVPVRNVKDSMRVVAQQARHKDVAREDEGSEVAEKQKVDRQADAPEIVKRNDEPIKTIVDEDSTKLVENTSRNVSSGQEMASHQENANMKAEKWQPEKTKFHLNLGDFSGIKRGVNNLFDGVGNAAGVIAENMHFGFGWTANVPLNETPYYWYSVAGKSQPYLSLIPSVWISKSFGDKTSITVDFNFCKMRNGYLNKSTANQQTTGNDSVAGGQQPAVQAVSTELVRLRTVQISPELNYRVSERWRLSAGVNWGIINGVLVRRVSADSTGTAVQDLIRLTSNDSLMSAVRTSVIDLKAGIDYQFRQARLGVELSLPLRNSSTNHQLKVQPFSVDVYLRFRIK